LKDQRAAADEIQKKMIVPRVFFHRSITKAGAQLGCPGSIPHDFRRTAIRNMVRAGIPERVAMKLSGHKTSAMETCGTRRTVLGTLAGTLARP